MYEIIFFDEKQIPLKFDQESVLSQIVLTYAEIAGCERVTRLLKPRQFNQAEIFTIVGAQI